MTGPLFPANLQRVWVVGTFIDLGGNPRRGSVTFTPSPSVLLDRVPHLIISGTAFSANLDSQSGSFAIQLPCTDDPDVTPVDWTYAVIEPTGRTYNIEVSIDTPAFDFPGHPLNGQQVVDLIDVVPAPAPSAGTVQLISGADGRGITDAEVDGNGHLILSFTDDTSSDAGYVGGSGSSGPRSYHHEQPVAALTWTVPHGLGFNPAGVMARDSTGLIEPADVTYPDTSTCVLAWGVPVAGSVDLS